MLKKEEMIPGAIVEIYRINKGVPGYVQGPGEPHILVTKEAGGFFDGGKGVRVGALLEIVQGPKRRDNINTAIVKFDTEEGQYQGHVFWCELRASGRLVQPAPVADTVPAKPARKTSAKLKAFSEKQLARLPAAGYWIHREGKMVTYYCVMNGAVKYIHDCHDGDWSTLLWTCCPTAGQIAAAAPGAFENFADHAGMLAKYPDVKRGAKVKAPNDL